jgi:hypothetical protein
MASVNLYDYDEWMKAQLRSYYGVETDDEVKTKIADLAKAKSPWLEMIRRRPRGDR